MSPETVVYVSDLHAPVRTIALDHFLSRYTRLTRNDKGVIAVGDANGVGWVFRRYHDALLDGTREHEHAFFSSHPIQQAQKLISAIDAAHMQGTVHGHLSPTNIAIDGENLILIDHFFCALAIPPARLDVAPEVSAGLGASAATDIYGLGLILRELLSQFVGSEHMSFINQMLAPEISMRPTLAEVKQVFSVGSSQRAENKALSGSVLEGSALQVPSGRLIRSAALAQGTPSAQIVRADIPPIGNTAVKAAIPITPSQVEPVVTVPSSKVDVDQVPLRAGKSSTGIFLAMILVGVGALGAFKFGYLDRFIYSNTAAPAVNSATATVDLLSYWRSGQPSLMREVVIQALAQQPSKVAESLIIADVMAHKDLPGVRSSLLRIAFNPAWERDLSESDRRIALGVGLASIYPEGVRNLPALKRAHAGVVLGMLAEMELQSGSKDLSEISISQLATLPAPYGPTFAVMGRLGAKTADEPAVQALAHLLTGEFGESTLKAYFAEDPLKKLGVLFPFLEERKGSDEISLIFEILKQHNSTKEVLTWFETEKLAEWEKVGELSKLSILIGIIPDTKLQPIQYIDLLLFPNAAVRKDAEDRLTKTSGNKLPAALLAFAISPQNKLGRGRSIVLLSALTLTTSEAQPLFLNWFDSSPDPQSVIALLIARNEVGGADIFNGLAADYLTKTKWHADLNQLKALCAHPEPLARATAYVKLDPKNPTERRVLEEMARIEPQANIRDGILKRLETAEEIEALESAKPSP